MVDYRLEQCFAIHNTLEQRFAKWTCDRLIEDADFGKRIIFSDEAHFDLGGYVNKQNCWIWGTENPPQNKSLFGMDFGP